MPVKLLSLDDDDDGDDDDDDDDDGGMVLVVVVFFPLCNMFSILKDDAVIIQLQPHVKQIRAFAEYDIT
jgi:hypothetical protein